MVFTKMWSKNFSKTTSLAKCSLLLYKRLGPLEPNACSHHPTAHLTPVISGNKSQFRFYVTSTTRLKECYIKRIKSMCLEVDLQFPFFFASILTRST